jgi:hypothetical protein
MVDASSKAYGTVGYLRSRYVEDIGVTWIQAKAKLTPLEGITIPRGELQGAVLGVGMGRTIQKSLKLQSKNIHFWTDSTNVLCWLQGESVRLKMFVHNRVQTILLHSALENWRWIPTEVNPADVVSRGLFMDQLVDCELWWKGPKFLREHPSEWPQQKKAYESTEEAAVEYKSEETILLVGGERSLDTVSQTVLKVAGHSVARILYAFDTAMESSTYTRQKWRYIVMIKAVQKLKSRLHKGNQEKYSFKELDQKAERTMLRFSQQRHYPEEIEKLKKNEEILLKSP